MESEKTSLNPDNTSDNASSNSGPDRIQFQGEATDDEVFDLDGKVTVDFINRTARDFMRDTAQAGAFLKVNTPSGFHPQVLYVKVLLAKKRLLGDRGNRDLLAVDNIMWEFYEAECETNVAQSRLCELIDDVMGRIDRTYGQRRPTNTHTQTHWSIR